ncbi:lactate utilization protein C [Streptomyces sp. SLBN-31]|uniref:LutC/YkgG family protein n=1 Tax=Streptomyces sp. SLBN-31 TaxID=2768444 RepID=UPI001154AC47|nr:lactate utilization protein C [Streptomyces sp. SLBN-31]TQJ91808.1 L-lactate dehydrogenase complex protein LldG [Streptomyces sp. SLBN-31]
MSSRDRILGRVRRALADVPSDDVPYEQAVQRDYLREHGGRSIEETVDLLADNLADYRAVVHRTTMDELADVIGRLLSERGSNSVLVPSGLDAGWLGGTDAERVADRAESSPGELDALDSVVTGCAVAIAETGTIVLDGSPDQGRRRITLVPDHHICVVRVPEQVVPSVPQALERLDPTRPLTWISGPSATSDIELDRVEGVHGPRTLEVVLVSGPPEARG